jgi:hypothetical protein
MSLKDTIDARAVDYRTTFGSPSGQRVLEDLARICFITTRDESAYARGDANETMFRLGCQEVFRTICLHLHLSPEQLFALYTGRNVKIGDTSDG